MSEGHEPDPAERAKLTEQDLAIATLLGRYIERRERDETPCVHDLLAVAAEMRAVGYSWEAVAEKVRRKPETCQKWPARHAAEWEPRYRAAQLKRFDDLHNEVGYHLNQLLRDGDKKVKAEAIKVLTAQLTSLLSWLEHRLPEELAKPPLSDDVATLKG